MVKFSPNQLKDFSESGYAWPFVEQLIRIITKGKFNHQQSLIYIYIYIFIYLLIYLRVYMHIYILKCIIHTYIYIYIYEQGPPHPPPPPARWFPPPVAGEGGFLSSQADIRKIYSSVQGVCQQCPRYCVSSTGEYT